MFSKVISIVLAGVLLHSSLAAQTESQPTVPNVGKMEQVLRKAQEKNKAVKVRLSRKIGNRTEISGKPSEISDTGFSVTDQKTGKVTKLAFQDVQEIKKKGMSKWKIALVVLAGVIIAAIAVGESID